MVCYSPLFENFPVCCDPHSQNSMSLGMQLVVARSAVYTVFIFSSHGKSFYYKTFKRVQKK